MITKTTNNKLRGYTVLFFTKLCRVKYCTNDADLAPNLTNTSLDK